MNLNKCLLVKNDCYRTGRTIRPKGVMVHSTGANNPMLKRYVQPNDGKLGLNKNYNSWNRNGTNACVHAFIGKLEDGSVATYQTLPWHWRGWHAGSGKNGSANNTHISFEICEDGLTDKTYFNKVYKEAVELTAYLCKLYDLDPLEDGVVICHSEGCRRGIASNHADVMHWFPKHGKNMDSFRADVKKELSAAKAEVKEKQPVKIEYARGHSATYNKAYTVKAKDGLNMRSGAGTNKDIIEVLPNGTKFRCYGYYTKQTDGTIWLYGVAKGKTGYCSKAYLV